MSFDDERRADAIRAVPVMPRTLFLLHNFYDIDLATIADRLATDEESVAASLVSARASIYRHWPGMSELPRGQHDQRGIELEERVRQEFRSSLEAAFATSGYDGRVAWPNHAAPIEDDEEAAAVFIVGFLHPSLRKVISRASRTGSVTANLWRHIPRWRRGLRDALLEVTSELRCAGWQRFDECLAERIAPERHYPNGAATFRRLRSPLPEEMNPPREGYWLPHWLDDPDRQAGFDRLPELTRLVYGLFQLSGRNKNEIARRLGISRRSVSRRLHRAIYAAYGWTYPNLGWKLLFAFDSKWTYWTSQWRRVRAVLRDR